MKTISGRNYYNETDFKTMCVALDAGERIEVYIDCIGHSTNNVEQENYRQAIVAKYGDKVEVMQGGSPLSYNYSYKLR